MIAKMPATQPAVKLYAVTFSARSESFCPPNVGASASTISARRGTPRERQRVVHDRADQRPSTIGTRDRAEQRHA